MPAPTNTHIHDAAIIRYFANHSHKCQHLVNELTTGNCVANSVRAIEAGEQVWHTRTGVSVACFAAYACNNLWQAVNLCHNLNSVTKTKQISKLVNIKKLK